MAATGAPVAPSREPWLIVMAASSGGVSALKTIVAALPPDFSASLIIVLHRSPDVESMLGQILERETKLPVRLPGHGQPIEPGVIYVTRPDLHLTVDRDRRFKYIDGVRIQHVRSAANPLFESAAAAFDGRLIAVVLTGYGSDAAEGVQDVKALGGHVIIQDPDTAECSPMPAAALRTGAVDQVLPLGEIGPALIRLVEAARSAP